MTMRAKMRELRKNKKGFTLMELIVVIVIIGILTAILVPGIVNWISRAKEVQLETDARAAMMQIQGEALEKYRTMSATEVQTEMAKTDVINAALGHAGFDTTKKDSANNAFYSVSDIKWEAKDDSVTITGMKFTENTQTIEYAGGKWILPSDKK